MVEVRETAPSNKPVAIQMNDASIKNLNEFKLRSKVGNEPFVLTVKLNGWSSFHDKFRSKQERVSKRKTREEQSAREKGEIDQRSLTCVHLNKRHEYGK